MSYPMSEKGTGMANKGIIYVATGADYVDLARRSAASADAGTVPGDRRINMRKTVMRCGWPKMAS